MMTGRTIKQILAEYGHRTWCGVYVCRLLGVQGNNKIGILLRLWTEWTSREMIKLTHALVSHWCHSSTVS